MSFSTSSGPTFPLDLAFAFDGSNSLTTEEFENVKQFATSVVQSFGVSQNGTRVALLEYSNRPRVIKKLSADQTEVLRAISNMVPSRNSGSATSQALREVARTIFSDEAGGRTNAPKALILITHSKSTSSEPVEQAVQSLRTAGVRVYVVGIGNLVDTRELESIATGKGAVHIVQEPCELPKLSVNVVRNINDDIKRSEFRVVTIG